MHTVYNNYPPPLSPFQSVDGTLFSGLTHTTTDSVNISLSVPLLTQEARPPDPLTNYLKVLIIILN